MSESNQAPPGESLRQKIVAALDGILVLHVTTVIGDASVAGADNSGAVSSVKLTSQTQKIANTVVNTMLGDSTSIYSPDFSGDPALVAAHAAAVQSAHDVRTETITLLKTILTDFKDILFPKPAGP